MWGSMWGGLERGGNKDEWLSYLVNGQRVQFSLRCIVTKVRPIASGNSMYWYRGAPVHGSYLYRRRKLHPLLRYHCPVLDLLQC